MSNESIKEDIRRLHELINRNNSELNELYCYFRKNKSQFLDKKSEVAKFQRLKDDLLLINGRRGQINSDRINFSEKLMKIRNFNKESEDNIEKKKLKENYEILCKRKEKYQFDIHKLNVIRDNISSLNACINKYESMNEKYQNLVKEVDDLKKTKSELISQIRVNENDIYSKRNILINLLNENIKKNRSSKIRIMSSVNETKSFLESILNNITGDIEKESIDDTVNSFQTQEIDYQLESADTSVNTTNLNENQ